MAKWIRIGNALIDSDQFIVLYAKKTVQGRGEQLPECKSWRIEAHRLSGFSTFLDYADNEEEAQKYLDVICEMLSAE